MRRGFESFEPMELLAPWLKIHKYSSRPLNLSLSPTSHKKISPVSADTGEILASVNAEDAAGAAGNNGGKGFCQG